MTASASPLLGLALMHRAYLRTEELTHHECPPNRTDLSTSTGTTALQHDGGFGVQAAPGFELAGRGLSLNLSADLALVTLPSGHGSVAPVQLDKAPGTIPWQRDNPHFHCIA